MSVVIVLDLELQDQGSILPMFTNGHGSISFQFVGRLWLGNNT